MPLAQRGVRISPHDSEKVPHLGLLLKSNARPVKGLFGSPCRSCKVGLLRPITSVCWDRSFPYHLEDGSGPQTRRRTCVGNRYEQWLNDLTNYFVPSTTKCVTVQRYRRRRIQRTFMPKLEMFPRMKEYIPIRDESI